jgi:hypothetical protein
MAQIWSLDQWWKLNHCRSNNLKISNDNQMFFEQQPIFFSNGDQFFSIVGSMVEINSHQLDN